MVEPHPSAVPSSAFPPGISQPPSLSIPDPVAKVGEVVGLGGVSRDVEEHIRGAGRGEEGGPGETRIRYQGDAGVWY